MSQRALVSNGRCNLYSLIHSLTHEVIDYHVPKSLLGELRIKM